MTQPVGLYDTTLRDGEQAVGVVLGADEKVELARLLDEVGVDRIEAGFPRVSEEDFEAAARIGRVGLRAEVWGFARALVADVEAVLRAGLASTVVEAPVSEVKLRAFGLTAEEVLRRVEEAVGFGARQGMRVAFFAVDGSRADLGFLRRAYEVALGAGAAELVVVDTLGVLSPAAAGQLVRRVRGWVGSAVPLHFHGHNDFGLATATALAAVEAGVRWVHGTVDGMGERAGNADLFQVALALAGLYGKPTGLRLERVQEVSRRVRELAGYCLEPWKPLVGENLFRRETGAVAAQFHVPEAIEPYAAEVVGARRRVVLGKKSGVASVRIKCDELGLVVPEEAYGELLARVKELAIRKRGLVSDEEFRTLVAEVV
ncbi:MAG: homoaconitate hydratase [Armatimonadota bacterium]|nr:homoaconitate hydratase [Armatimonadota bacterium]MDW8155812.1 homoaconitate hydratase [Armatimonadota bacterium]